VKAFFAATKGEFAIELMVVDATVVLPEKAFD
jgi:hypothetical protein